MRGPQAPPEDLFSDGPDLCIAAPLCRSASAASASAWTSSPAHRCLLDTPRYGQCTQKRHACEATLLCIHESMTHSHSLWRSCM